MIVTASYTTEAVRNAVLAQTGYTGFHGQVAGEASDLTLQWWQQAGFSRWRNLPTYDVENCPDTQRAFSEAFQFVRPRITTSPQGFGFVIPAFILIAIISAVVQWVVQLILEYLFRDHTAAVAFGQGG